MQAEISRAPRTARCGVRMLVQAGEHYITSNRQRDREVDILLSAKDT